MPAPAATKYTFGHAMLEHWPLDPAILYLNHGTVGVVPRRVLRAAEAIRAELERMPARFLLRELADVKQGPMSMPPRMRTAAAQVAAWVRARAEDVVFVENATTGCNAVLRSFDFKAGDEILVTDQVYGGVRRAADYVASRTGAVVRSVTLPYPGTTPEAVIGAIEGALTARTRLLIVEHVVALSALILPVAAIAAACRKRDIVTLVDGAHAPGTVPLDIPALGVDFYTGNLHKWALAARPLALLWVAPERQAGTHPVVISWGYPHGLTHEFDLPGTRDPSPALSAPEALAFMRELGEDAMREWNHRVAYGAARMLTSHWGTEIPAPESMYGSMITIPLPALFGSGFDAANALKDALLFEHHIEAQVNAFQDRLWIRLAAQVYNEPADFERLRDAVDAVQQRR